MKSQSFRVSNSLYSSVNSNHSPLLREPFIRLKIIEAKDVFLTQGTRRDVGDLYAIVTYETEASYKTNTVTRSSSPKWDAPCEFDYYTAENEEGNLISISIYDADPLGSDELIATQIINLPYFKQMKRTNKAIDFWVKLDPVNNVTAEEQIVLETDTSIYQDLNLTEFEEELIKDPAVIKDDKIPKLHLSLEMFDLVTLKHFNVSITEVEETRENGLLECKVFMYIIKVTRNDGLEWYVKRRYSEIRAFRQTLAQRSPAVREIPFPGKTLLKFTSKIFSNLDKEYQKVCTDRKDLLEKFLKKIVQMDRHYDMREFNKFFSVHDRQF